MYYHHCWFILSYSLIPKKRSGTDLHGQLYQRSHGAAPYPVSMQKSKEGESPGFCFEARSNCLTLLVHGVLLTAALKGNEEKQAPAAYFTLQLFYFQRSISRSDQCTLSLKQEVQPQRTWPCTSVLILQNNVPFLTSVRNSRFCPRAAHR